MAVGSSKWLGVLRRWALCSALSLAVLSCSGCGRATPGLGPQPPPPLASHLHKPVPSTRALSPSALGSAGTPLSPVPAALLARVDLNARRVEGVRGRKFVHAVRVRETAGIVSHEKQRGRSPSRTARPSPPQLPEHRTAKDRLRWRLLAALGFVRTTSGTPRVDSSSDVEAWYDAQAHELVLPADGGGAADDLLMHELTHALQDQHGDLNRLELRCGEQQDSDETLAARCLCEGEAQLVALTAAGVSDDDEARGEQSIEALGNAWLHAAPSSVHPSQDRAAEYEEALRQLPYSAGLRYVWRAWRRGGWGAVDLLHRSPPSSTAAILHPDSPFGKPTAETASTRPDPLPSRLLERVRNAGFQEAVRERLGEARLRLLLRSAPSPLPFDSRMPSPWEDDVLIGYASPPPTAVPWVLITAWRSEQEASSFAGSARAWAAAPRRSARGPAPHVRVWLRARRVVLLGNLPAPLERAWRAALLPVPPPR